MKHFITILGSLFVIFTVLAADESCIESHTVLFSSGDSVSRFYRIPALAKLPDGRIIAVADRRLKRRKDLPNEIDVVSRTSCDGGLTWSQPVAVAINDSIGGYGDAAVGVDPVSGDAVCVMVHGNGFWESTPDNHARLCVSRSADGGASWSEPLDFTDSIYTAIAGAAPLQAIGAFASSGGMYVDADGTMMCALVVRRREPKGSRVDVHRIVSRDGGHTWKPDVAAVTGDGDESKIVRVSDGSLLASIRNRYKGHRRFARSYDEGHTWGDVFETNLPDPACNGDIIGLPDGTLLHSIPDSEVEREKTAIFASEDNGNSWRKLATIWNGDGGYSSIALIDDDTLGMFVEEYIPKPNRQLSYNLHFFRINLSKLLK